MGGTLERHPGLRVLLAHAGGAIVALRGRLRHGHAAVAAAGAVAGRAARRARRALPLRHGHPRPGRSCARSSMPVGADRVLLGSDYPFDMGDADPVGTVRAAGLGGRRAGACWAAMPRGCWARRGEPVPDRPRAGGHRQLGAAADRQRRRLQRLRAGHRVDLERWEEWLDAWSCRPPRSTATLGVAGAGRGHARSAGEAFARAAVCFHFAKFVWVLDPERNRACDRRRGGRRWAMPTRCSTRPRSGSRRRSTAAPSWPTCAGRRSPDRRFRSSCSFPAWTRPRRSSSSGSRCSWPAGWPRCRSTGPVRGRPGSRSTSDPTTRSAVAAILDAVADRAELDLERVGAVGRQPRRLLRRARGRVRAAPAGHRRGQRPVQRGRPVGHHARRSRARRSSTTPAPPRRSDGRARAAALDLDGVAERVKQPCLVVTGRRTG